MYQELFRKITEEKPSYNQEELQWLLEHLGDPSPEIRDELVFTSLARGIQEELFSAGVKKVSSCSSKNCSNSLAIIEQTPWTSLDKPHDYVLKNPL